MPLATRAQVGKYDKLCIKNEEFYIKSEELCIQNEELCIKIYQNAQHATTCKAGEVMKFASNNDESFI